MSQKDSILSIDQLSNISSLGLQIQNLIKLLSKFSLNKDDIQNWVDAHKDKPKLNTKDSAISLLCSCGTLKLALKLKDVISSDQKNLLYQISIFDTKNYEEVTDSVNNLVTESHSELQEILKIESHLLYYSIFPNKVLINVLYHNNRIYDRNWGAFFSYIDLQHQNLVSLGKSYLHYISYSIILDFFPTLSPRDIAKYKNYIFNDSSYANVFIKLKLNFRIIHVYNCLKNFSRLKFQEEVMESLVDQVYMGSTLQRIDSMKFLRDNFTEKEREFMYAQCFCAYVGATLTDHSFVDNPIMKNWINSLFKNKLHEVAKMNKFPEFKLENACVKCGDDSNIFVELNKIDSTQKVKKKKKDKDIIFSWKDVQPKVKQYTAEDDNDDDMEGIIPLDENGEPLNENGKARFTTYKTKSANIEKNEEINDDLCMTDEEYEVYMREFKKNKNIEFFVSLKDYPDTYTAKIFCHNRFLAEYQSNTIMGASKKCIVVLFKETDTKTLNYFNLQIPPALMYKRRVEVETLPCRSKKQKIESVIELKDSDDETDDNDISVTMNGDSTNFSALGAFPVAPNLTSGSLSISTSARLPPTASMFYQSIAPGISLNRVVSTPQHLISEAIKVDDIDPESKNTLYALSNRIKVAPEYRYSPQVSGLFLAEIFINNVKIAEAVHRNKKLSSQRAATLALRDKDMLVELGLID